MERVGGVLRTAPRTRGGKVAVALVVLTLVGLVAGVVINVWMVRAERSAQDDVAAAPHAQAAIVLGARVYPGHVMSPMLADRVARGIELYRAGKVDKLLMSGDHAAWKYDEPGTMRDAAVAAGVPPQDVFTDHAGFDTWATMRRAREVFGVDSAVVVSQRFHLPRALYLAHAAGLRATGVAVEQHDYGTGESTAARRELLARVKAWVSVTTHRPVLLGPRIPITGDGRRSWGQVSAP